MTGCERPCVLSLLRDAIRGNGRDIVAATNRDSLDLIGQYGWSTSLASAFEPHERAGHTPGRIILHQRDGYVVATDNGEIRAKVSGRLRH